MEAEHQRDGDRRQQRAEQAIEDQQDQNGVEDVQSQVRAVEDPQVVRTTTQGVVQHQRRHRNGKVVGGKRRGIQHFGEEAGRGRPARPRDERVVHDERGVVQRESLGAQDRPVREGDDSRGQNGGEQQPPGMPRDGRPPGDGG
jgi:hypothetical protein